VINLTGRKRVAHNNALVLVCAFAFAMGVVLTMPSSAMGDMDCRFWKNADMYGGTCIGGGGGCGICIDSIPAARAKTSSCVSSKGAEASCRQADPQVALMSWPSEERRSHAHESIVPGPVLAQKIPACRGDVSLFDAVDPRERQAAAPMQASMPPAASVTAELLLGP
jgi:hypothetical protein